MRDRKVRMVFAASLAALCAQPVWQARAQEAGKAEVRILVGFPAGGTVDAIARVVADKLKNAAGGPVLIENKPGAAGLVATKALLASPPDGTVLLLAGVSAVAIEPIIRPREQFDPTRDLAPITLATRSEYGLAVSNALNVRNLQELVQWARANPSKAAFGSPGAGSPAPSFRSAVRRLSRDRYAPRAFQRRRAVDHRPHRRAHPGGREPGDRFHRTPQEREVTSAGDQRCQAFRIHSRCCDLCRTRVQRSTGGPLVRILGPGQNTCDDHYPA